MPNTVVTGCSFRDAGWLMRTGLRALGLAAVMTATAPGTASAATWSDTIRYDELCGTVNFSTCGTTPSPFFSSLEPNVVRMTFFTPTAVTGGGRLDLRIYGDFDSPQEYLDVFIEPPSFVDSALLAADTFANKGPAASAFPLPGEPGASSCFDCFLEVGGERYEFSRLTNWDSDDDRFDHTETRNRPSVGPYPWDRGYQWTGISTPSTTLSFGELSDWVSDGKLELAFHFSPGQVQGNPFTDGATYTDAQRAAFEFNWLEATLSMEVAGAGVPAVPLPAPVLMILSGLAGLTALRRRRA